MGAANPTVCRPLPQPGASYQADPRPAQRTSAPCASPQRPVQRSVAPPECCKPEPEQLRAATEHENGVCRVLSPQPGGGGKQVGSMGWQGVRGRLDVDVSQLGQEKTGQPLRWRTSSE